MYIVRTRGDFPVIEEVPLWITDGQESPTKATAIEHYIAKQQLQIRGNLETCNRMLRRIDKSKRLMKRAKDL